MPARATPNYRSFAQETARLEGSHCWPLSSSQLRVWFVEQLAEGTAVNNLCFGARLTGELDLAALDLSLRVVVDRHEALRTTFEIRDGEPIQLTPPKRITTRAGIDHTTKSMRPS